MRSLIVLFVTACLTCVAYGAEFTLSSKVIKNGEKISENQVYNGFGCKGKNQAPDLQWTGVPVGTKAFALTMFDPDAPTGSGWWHWVVFNIPPNAKGIPAMGDLPTGSVQARTDFGAPGYGGPCPPPGKPHRYIFTVYALKEPLKLTSDATAAMVSFEAKAKKIAEAKIEALYGR